MAAFPAFFGYNFVLWVVVGLSRFITEVVLSFVKGRVPQPRPTDHLIPKDVAVIMAARNEASALPATLRALKKNLPARNIYVGSDASTDNTVAIAKKYGCQIVDLHPNRGKSNVLAYLVQHFAILKRYKAVIIMDAEVVVSDHYLDKILPYFDDPNVAAFVSHALSRWHTHRIPRWSMFFTAYRIRLWLTLYYGLRYGQTWKYTSVTPIIPGGSSVYRSSVLAQMEINTPGFIIEDFHMTFQVHHKKLGRIASHPSAYVIDQEPYNLRDYCRQVYRWFLGFWQTVFYHGFWPSFFWFATAFFTLEMLLASIIILTAPLLILLMPFLSFAVFHFTFIPLGIVRVPVTITTFLIGLFVIDYVITVLTTLIERKPMLLIYGLGFFLLRYIDTVIFLWTLPLALLEKTATGQWISPTRRSAP